jgi:uncharacterized repeat protein (TIGR01451 family)
MSSPAFGASMGTRFLSGSARIALALCAIGFSSLAISQTAPGTLISNSAVLEFTRPNGITDTVFSNTVNATVEPPPSSAAISLLRATNAASSTQQSTAGPTSCRVGGAFSPLPPPVIIPGGAVNPLQPIAMVDATTVHGGEAVFVQLNDPDQNRDATAIDTLELRLTSVIGDSETIRLSETSVNTGAFVGYIQTRVATPNVGDCVLQVERNSQISSIYVDPMDAQDSVNASVLVDPFGVVFDSSTGDAVNGSVVRLIDAATGQPAIVFGDDGVSRYPSTMTTGQPVTDAGGTIYTLPPGVFRFPLVATGQYRLEVTPPISHLFPSQKTQADLNQLPGAPFRLQTGSFGNNFPVAGPPAVAVDIPVDPSNARLFLQKTTTTTIASPGDFVQYALTVENAGDTGTFQTIRIEDRLPAGMRYRKGSTRIATRVASDPTIGDDGRTLTFAVAQLPPRARVAITYVAEITQSARGPQLINRARATSGNGVSSNDTQVAIRLREDVFKSKAILMGRVVTGECDKPIAELTGVGGVRVYMEDGRYALTDKEGKYHFEGVEPGNHVVQLDAISVPPGYEPAGCGEKVAHSGRAYSQFVDLRGGALWRADFRLTKIKPPPGSVGIDMSTTMVGDMELTHSIVINVSGNSLTNARAVAVLPTGLDYIANSARLNATQAIEPRNGDGILSFALDQLQADAAYTLTFRSRVTEQAAGALPVSSYLLFDTPSATKQVTAPTENRILRGEMS